MTTESGLSEGSPKRFASSSGTGNFTQIDGETCSLYSISASASAVSNGIDQYTGFLLRYTMPCSTKAAKVRRMSASYAGAFVLYSFAQSARTPSRLNCAVCREIQPSAKASQRARNSDVDTVRFCAWISLATFCSIGSP